MRVQAAAGGPKPGARGIERWCVARRAMWSKCWRTGARAICYVRSPASASAWRGACAQLSILPSASGRRWNDRGAMCYRRGASCWWHPTAGVAINRGVGRSFSGRRGATAALGGRGRRCGLGRLGGFALTTGTTGRGISDRPTNGDGGRFAQATPGICDQISGSGGRHDTGTRPHDALSALQRPRRDRQAHRGHQGCSVEPVQTRREAAGIGVRTKVCDGEQGPLLRTRGGCAGTGSGFRHVGEPPSKRDRAKRGGGDCRAGVLRLRWWPRWPVARKGVMRGAQ